MKYTLTLLTIIILVSCRSQNGSDTEFYTLSKDVLKDKIKGAWAAQTVGVTYGGPTEFRNLKKTIPDSIPIVWTDTTLNYWMTDVPGLYDDIYMDLTFVEVMEREGIDAPATSHAKAYAEAKYWLWHANQQGRYNILNGLLPPESGHWLNNPHADDIDFQIEADFAGIMNPGMPNSALQICDKVGHIMNSGDGYYGGVLVAAMYSFAFTTDNIPEIVENALSVIPAESTFYQCISDVIKWHGENPGDWRAAWQLIEDKWGKDIGCPDGAYSDFNIDAKINAAYVVLGLLYGEGDLGKTMEIATRAGQDSDCNPGTAGGIVGTVLGYDQIPDFWKQGLSGIENMNFKFTNTSLNKVYDTSYEQALEMIERNGGAVSESEVNIRIMDTDTVALEQNFIGYSLGDHVEIDERFTLDSEQSYEVEFEGVGVVLRGKVGNLDYEEKYALESESETLDNYELLVNFSLDGKESKSMKLPLWFIERAHELYYQYELPPGKHSLKFEIVNPHEKVYLDVWDLITYK